MEWADKIFEELQNDLKIDEANIGEESLRISSNLFCKYQRLYSEASIELERLKIGMGSLYMRRWRYYKGDGLAEEYQKEPLNIKIRTDHELKQCLEHDEILAKARLSISIQEQKVEIYKSCVWQLKEVSKSARLFFDNLKFLSGA